jgi:hypothetical protein
LTSGCQLARLVCEPEPLVGDRLPIPLAAEHAFDRVLGQEEVRDDWLSIPSGAWLPEPEASTRR